MRKSDIRLHHVCHVFLSLIESFQLIIYVIMNQGHPVIITVVLVQPDSCTEISTQLILHTFALSSYKLIPQKHNHTNNNIIVILLR